MWFFYLITHNYAASILFFTFITRLILFPLSVKQQKSQAAMSAFTPKLEEIKKKYANNPQKQSEEQMKLYSEEGINPLASCLPLLIQLPILYGVFDVVYRPITHIIRTSKEVITEATTIAAQLFGTDRNFQLRPEIYVVRAVKENPELFTSLPAEFTEKIHDFHNTLFGLDLGLSPSFTPEVWNATAIGLIMIPIASGLAQLLSTIYMSVRQKKMAQAAGSSSMQNSMMKSMNVMMFIMPVFSVFIAIGFPAAIGYYWTCSALIGFLQSVLLYRIYTPEYVAKLVERDKLKKKDKVKKRSSMMERYQQMLAEQNGTAAPVQQNSITVSGPIKNDDGDFTDTENDVTKMSKSQQRDLERKLINEARRRQAEKYGEDYTEE
jgi:YidC/Oxa1 family membrane protein insertase